MNMIQWRIIVEFQPENMSKGIVALKKITSHLQKKLDWPEIQIYRGFIGVEENRCDVVAYFKSLAEFEEAWKRWGKSPESKVLAEGYHKLVESEKIEIYQRVN
jgi:hypothetical protein